jgi:hypothetical protein
MNAIGRYACREQNIALGASVCVPSNFETRT